MTSDELKQRLSDAYGLKRRFGFYDPRRVFDTDWHLPTPQDARDRVRHAIDALDSYGLSPRTNYAANGSDCDNWALWIASGVTKRWSLEHKGQTNFPAYPIGQIVGKSDGGEHAWCCVVTTEGCLTFDYGEEKEVRWQVYEGTFV